MTDKKIEVIIIGGGLVGTLCACFMAQRGYQVSVYEKREDIRGQTTIKGRSINLALSHRGRKSLRTVGLEQDILKSAIPMKGRLLHGTNGELKSMLYDSVSKECIYSVGRNYLNKKLVEETGNYNNVTLFFNYKLIKTNFEHGSVTFVNLRNSQTVEVKADLIIGADGAYSSLRSHMQQTPLFQLNQTYIEHGYLELSVPSNVGHKMAPHHLHIWPRGEFMMIALPNIDLSWTVTLFMPFQRFDELTNQEKVIEFFKTTFPDALELMLEEELVEIFFTTKPSALVSIKCSPYNFGSKFLLIGDAAHAMVPFYGQGMNAGFEDCFILNQLLDKYQDKIDITLREFSNIRVPAAQAICDLAMYNYVEMRDLVQKRSYLIRKFVDDWLFKIFGNKWIPLYNSVSFSNIDYQKCLRNREWQNLVIKSFLIILACFISVTAMGFIFTNTST